MLVNSEFWLLKQKLVKIVKILILRDGKRISIDAKIGELKENVAQKNEEEKLKVNGLV